MEKRKKDPAAGTGRASGKDVRLGIGPCIALLFTCIFFSGIFKGSGNWTGILDFSTLCGSFGSIVTQPKVMTFAGAGGSGAKDGFLFACSLLPPVMLAIGMIQVSEYFGALEAARKLMTPLLKSCLGIPGAAGLTLIASLQNVDVGAVMTKELWEAGEITDRQRSIFAAFQLSGGAVIVNFFGSGAALFALTCADGSLAVTMPMIIPFTVIVAFKIFGTNLMRLYLHFMERESEICPE